MGNLKTWFMQTRPSFLLLVPVCLFTGAAVSLFEGYAFQPLYFALAFIGGLFAHIAVNVLNEYSDYKTGIDFRTTPTPFSGGTKILPSGQLNPRRVLIFGLSCLAITAAIGIYFITVYQWKILPVGLVGVVIVLLYTPYLTRLPGITELVGPGLGFGLMVFGTYVTQSGQYYSAGAIVASVVAGLLIADLLLINEFPDVEADKPAGRKHLPIILGKTKAGIVYSAFLIGAYVAIIAGAAAGVLPWLALVGLLTLPLGFKAMRAAVKYNNDMSKLGPAMGADVITVLVTPLLMSIGIVIATYVM
ncbi:MAG: prenyltransferase [Dehalococcoidia bacterium]|jgi:1,4-dihydroxy-2-naphthoate octaprenyltransferase